MDGRRTAQLALVLGGFFGEDVTLERLAPLDRPATTDLEALGSAPLGFHLRHDVTLLLAMFDTTAGDFHATKILVQPARRLSKCIKYLGAFHFSMDKAKYTSRNQ